MCIIVSKNKGVSLPSKKTLKTCFNYNNDGCGFMYVRNDKVMIDKGYMTFKDFYKRLQELKKEFGNDLKDKALVMHFRIGTAGNNSPQNTHPYPVTSNVEDLHALNFECDLGIAHNGVMHDYNPKKNDNLLDMNDTQVFIRDFVDKFRTLNKDFYKIDFIRDIILKESGYNKFAILDNKENLYLLGEFVEENGVYYSNTTYKPYVFTHDYNTIYPKYDYYYDDYFYDDYDTSNCVYDDYSTTDEVDFWTYLDNYYVLELDHNKTYYIGGENEFKELDNKSTYGIDANNNLYEIDYDEFKLIKVYDYIKGKQELYNQDFMEIGYQDFI